MPDDTTLQCTSPMARMIERNLAENILNHELFNDDKIVPDTYQVFWDVPVDFYGIGPIVRDNADDGHGHSLGYKIHHPITNLREQFDILKGPVLTPDFEGKRAHFELAKDIFGDILPPEMVARSGGVCLSLTQHIIMLMGMQEFFIALMEDPEMVHKLMRLTVDNTVKVKEYMEAHSLLTVNNGCQFNGPTTYSYTDDLPAKDFDGVHVRGKDVWVWAESQETTGISPTVFDELIAPYYAEACSHFGLVYYGCCEPVSPFWEKSLSKIPNIRKTSISRWCDEKVMGDKLRGTNIVFSRKPDPNFLGVGYTLDEAGWAEHIRTTLEHTKGCQVEFVIRDVCTLSGNVGKVRTAIDIARREILKARG